MIFQILCDICPENKKNKSMQRPPYIFFMYSHGNKNDAVGFISQPIIIYWHKRYRFTGNEIHFLDFKSKEYVRGYIHISNRTNLIFFKKQHPFLSLNFKTESYFMFLIQTYHSIYFFVSILWAKWNYQSLIHCDYIKCFA